MRPDGATGRGDEGVDPDRLRLLARLGEHRHDHPEHDGRSHRAADALDEARADQELLAGREAADERRGGEHAKAGEEDPAARSGRHAAGQEQQAAERDQVRVHDPGEARLREAEVVLDSGSATFTIVASRTIISTPRQRT